jgi:hypothetical protein
MQHVDDRLGRSEIARRHHRHETFAGDFVDMHLREDRDVVDARIGARVREHDQPIPHQNSAAIGHGK